MVRKNPPKNHTLWMRGRARETRELGGSSGKTRRREGFDTVDADQGQRDSNTGQCNEVMRNYGEI